MIFVIMFFALTSLPLLSTPASAQDATEYQLLEKLPYVETSPGTGSTNAKSYLEGAFKLIILLAGVLAVVLIIYGGITYMSTDAFTGKSNAKGIIQNALWGLVLVLGAWIILYTINPDLLTLNLSLERLPVGGAFDTTLGSSTPGTGTSGAVPYGGTRGPSFGQAWGDDSVLRNQLKSSINVDVNRSGTCKTIGEQNCTSIYNLNPKIIGGLARLGIACQCGTITISGGTEYWLHGNKSTEESQNGTDHKPGENGSAVDLSKNNAQLNNFIQSKPKNNRPSNGCSNLGQAYTFDGGTYVNEGDHWHVCY